MSLEPKKQDYDDASVKSSVFIKYTQGQERLFSAVLMLLLIGFVTVIIAVASPIIDAWRFRATTYQDLVNRISEQNYKIDNLSEYLHRKLK